jgi:hypothetical protein
VIAEAAAAERRLDLRPDLLRRRCPRSVGLPRLEEFELVAVTVRHRSDEQAGVTLGDEHLPPPHPLDQVRDLLGYRLGCRPNRWVADENGLRPVADPLVAPLAFVVGEQLPAHRLRDHVSPRHDRVRVFGARRAETDDAARLIPADVHTPSLARRAVS